MPKKIFLHKDFRYARSKYSPFMKRLLQNKKISGVMQKPVERENFYKTVKELEVQSSKEKGYDPSYSGNLKVMRKALWKLKKTPGDQIEDNEVRIIAREMIPFGPKYVDPGKSDFKSGKGNKLSRVEILQQKMKPAKPAPVKKISRIFPTQADIAGSPSLKQRGRTRGYSLSRSFGSLGSISGPAQKK